MVNFCALDLTQEAHPDRLAASLSAEEIDAANERFRRVRGAFEALREKMKRHERRPG